LGSFWGHFCGQKCAKKWIFFFARFLGVLEGTLRVFGAVLGRFGGGGGRECVAKNNTKRRFSTSCFFAPTAPQECFGRRFGGPCGAISGSKMGSKVGQKVIQNWSQKSIKNVLILDPKMESFLGSFSGHFWDPDFKRFREGPRGLQEAPRGPRESPKTSSRPPQRAPRGLQEGPRRPQDGPRRPQERPRRLQDGPRRPQEGSKRAQEGCKTVSDGPRRLQDCLSTA
jgi:hypothetical protein